MSAMVILLLMRGPDCMLSARMDEHKEARSKLKLRPARFTDYQQIAALESRYGLDPRDYERWTHLWVNNPLYRVLRKDWEIGWVVEDERKRVVGSVGNIPLPYEFGGCRITAASGRGLVAEPEYRSAALLLLGRLIHQPGVDVYLNNTISKAAASSFAAFECHRVPVGMWDRAAFWITGPRVFCERMLRVKTQRLAKPLSYPLGAAASIWDRVARQKWRETDVEVQACERFDERFDAFWEERKRRNPAVLLAVRTSDVLTWHFKVALGNHRLWIAAVMDGPRIVAYSIFERADHPIFRVSRMRFVDFQSLDQNSELFLPLLSWALKKCRTEGIQMLEVAARLLGKGELIDAIAPHRRSLSTWTYFYHASNPKLAEHLQHRQAWDPSLFDGDATL
jgi:hypothetical protein